MSKDTTLNEIKELQRQIEDKKKCLRPLFESGLQEIFAKYPNVETIKIHVNNHEFCDGNPTHFNLYYDDLGVYFDNGSCLDPYNDDEGTVPDNAEEIQSEFADFFKSFDVDDFYESIYGDEYEEIEFHPKK